MALAPPAALSLRWPDARGSSSRAEDGGRRLAFRQASTSYSGREPWSSGKVWWRMRGRWRSMAAGTSDGGTGNSNGNGGSKGEGRDNGWHRQAAANAFSEEAIGGEHGEGFSSFRSRGPLHVDVDFLNDRMRERGLQRIRYAMRPDEAFGLIYSWDNVLADTHTLKMRAWKKLAQEEGQQASLDAVRKRQLLATGAEYIFRQVLRWGQTAREVERLTSRLGEIYTAELGQVEVPREGLKEWLEALDTAGVPCAVASSMDRLSLNSILERIGLRRHFRAVISEEDGMESTAHRFLSAAVKLDRPPCKCVVFEDDPRGIAAAHNCSMKAVALIGSHCAYELTQADLAVSSFTELSVINLRRLFANKGAEFMDLQKQQEEKKPCKRKLVNDTLF